MLELRRISYVLILIALLSTTGCGHRYSQDDIPRLMQELKGGNSLERTNAARAFLKFGPEAKEAIPVLVDALGDDVTAVRNYSGNALVRMGPDAVGPLIQALEDQSYYKRGFAAWALGRIGPEPGVVQALIKTLDDEMVFVKELAIRALVEIGPEAGPALEKLYFLAQYDPSVFIQVAAKDAIHDLTGQ